MLFMFVFFFFFKQKTAYEMRISDWSSDVCSSDLQRQGLLRSLREAGRTRHQGRSPDAARTDLPLPAPDIAQGAPAVPGGGGCLVPEIGRASCRERVCQYV